MSNLQDILKQTIDDKLRKLYVGKIIEIKNGRGKEYILNDKGNHKIIDIEWVFYTHTVYVGELSWEYNEIPTFYVNLTCETRINKKVSKHEGLALDQLPLL